MYPAKLLHMREMLGGKWSPVEEYVGITKRVRQLIVNEPGYAARIERCTQVAIDTAYKELNPIPLTEWDRIARNIWVDLKKDPGGDKLRDFLVMLEKYLEGGRPKTASAFEKVSAGYMDAVVVQMSKALHYGTKSSGWFGGPPAWKAALLKAEQGCERNIRLTDQALLDAGLSPEERKMLGQLRALLLVNWIAAVLEQAKRGFNRTLDEVVALLQERRALQSLRECLAQHPYLWQCAYNGLDTASICHEQDEDMLFFHGHLTRLDRGFESFDYSPGEVPSISAEPGMKYFRERFPHLHKPNNPK
jgi:hypothetical protein